MDKKDLIFVAGGTGLVGSAIIRRLLRGGFRRIVAAYSKAAPDPERLLNGQEGASCVEFVQLDLISQSATLDFFERRKPECVFLAAAKVGGIYANNVYRAQFIYENLQIQNSVIHSSYLNGVKKLLFLGSSCIYPRACPQPIREEYLLTGPLEYTNEPYALAKIAGVKMCESYNLQYGTDYKCVMPTNLYGDNDNFDLKGSHVLPAIMRKMHLAHCLELGDWDGIATNLQKHPDTRSAMANADRHAMSQLLEQVGISQKGGQIVLTLWGSGTPRREFLHSDDLADACVFLLEKNGSRNFAEHSGDKTMGGLHVNVGWGEDISIADLAEVIRAVVGFKGSIAWDRSKPDGTFQKLLDISRLVSIGWRPTLRLENGIAQVYRHYIRQMGEQEI